MAAIAVVVNCNCEFFSHVVGSELYAGDLVDIVYWVEVFGVGDFNSNCDVIAARVFSVFDFKMVVLACSEVNPLRELLAKPKEILVLRPRIRITKISQIMSIISSVKRCNCIHIKLCIVISRDKELILPCGRCIEQPSPDISI
ncbi:MAG: hypothetical protein QF535_04005 [Anaerolineales bacterium]|nr:hypothetical protein [Anaerolineales bacterium]